MDAIIGIVVGAVLGTVAFAALLLFFKTERGKRWEARITAEGDFKRHADAILKLDTDRIQKATAALAAVRRGVA